jgi:hypothetical protein
LALVAQNSRFLLLTERLQFPNLASRVLALCTQRLPDDWRAPFGHPVLVAESFVHPEHFVGTCYKAAGWHCLGPTGGFARDSRDFYRDLDAPKQLWGRPLHPHALQWLRAETLPPHLAAQLPETPPRGPYKSAQLDPLCQRFHDRLTDPRARRGKRHRLATIVAIAALATLAGEKGPKGFARFAALLTQPQRRHLRCRPNKHSGPARRAQRTDLPPRLPASQSRQAHRAIVNGHARVPKELQWRAGLARSWPPKHIARSAILPKYG